MILSPAKLARAGVLVAAMALAAVTAIGFSPASAVPLPTPTPSPSPTGGSPSFEAGVFCPPKTCIGGNGFICAGGSDCGLWFLRHYCTDCPQLTLDFDLRAYTTAREPEMHTGNITFAAGRAATILVFRPSASVTSIDIQLAINGVVVHHQTIT